MDLKRLEVYKIGIKPIDEEHFSCFIMLDELEKALMSNTITEDNINKSSIWLDFENKLKTHFQNEELLMESLNYPYVKEHKRQHVELLTKFYIIFSFNPSNINIHPQHIVDDFFNLLLEHIDHHDINYAAFIKECIKYGKHR